MQRNFKIYSSVWDMAYIGLMCLVLWIALLTVLIPIIFIISASFSSPDAIASGKVLLWPVDPTLIGYKTIFKYDLIMSSYANTIKYTMIGTIINLFMTILAAYPLSRKDLKIRNAVMFYFSFTMLFSGGMIPMYLLVRSLNMLNTIWALVIPGALGVWNVIITRTFIQVNIPEELYECASLEGCSDIRYVVFIVLPLSKPILAVLTLMCAVGHWNSFFGALLYLTDESMYPLQLVLRNILIENQFNVEMLKTGDIQMMAERSRLQNLLKYSLIIVASMPVMLLYPFIQKYFVKGIMVGALKG